MFSLCVPLHWSGNTFKLYGKRVGPSKFPTSLSGSKPKIFAYCVSFQLHLCQIHKYLMALNNQDLLSNVYGIQRCEMDLTVLKPLSQSAALLLEGLKQNHHIDFSSLRNFSEFWFLSFRVVIASQDRLMMHHSCVPPPSAP